MPGEISVFSTLTFLNASWNLYTDDVTTTTTAGIFGTIPTEFGMLSDLEELHLHHNDLTGDATQLLESLNAGLVELDLNDNKLTGFLPASVDRYTRLTHFGFFDNELDGTLPTEIGRLVELTNFDVGANRFLSGTIPTELGQCTKLERLDLGGNRFGGTIPSELAQLTGLGKKGIGRLFVWQARTQ